jgi:TonB-dependent starch-binding outer membrane protein SusC
MKKTKTARQPAALLWTLVLCMLAFSQAYAQQETAARKITGKVTGKMGEEPLVSASVTIKGTTTSVSTNSTGDFTIEAKTGDILVISSIGYAATGQIISTSGWMRIIITCRMWW